MVQCIYKSFTIKLSLNSRAIIVSTITIFYNYKLKSRKIILLFGKECCISILLIPIQGFLKNRTINLSNITERKDINGYLLIILMN